MILAVEMTNRFMAQIREPRYRPHKNGQCTFDEYTGVKMSFQQMLLEQLYIHKQNKQKK